MQKLYFYTTLGCHLCEKAAELLEEIPCAQQFDVCYRDIADDVQLIELYGVRIPVLKREDNSRELVWPFDAWDVQQFLVER